MRERARPMLKLTSSLVLGSLLFWSGVAHADVQHTVGKGHTLHSIAGRYHVTVKSIMEANNLKDSKHLKPGMVLTIPGVDAPSAKKGDKSKDEAGKAKAAAAVTAKNKEEAAKKGATKPAGYQQKPKTPGVVHFVRPGLKEDLTVKVADRHGRVVAGAPKAIEAVLRSQSTGSTHVVDRRLAGLVANVSDHFGGRTIQVVSGFRPYSPKQYTKHSNHNHGKAIDFRVSGVPNATVRDYCRTIKNVGCGYYPNSTFVHMDARTASVYWVDYSKAGEAPRYQTPNVEADEGTSDVHAETDVGIAPTEPAAADAVTESAPREPLDRDERMTQKP